MKIVNFDVGTGTPSTVTRERYDYNPGGQLIDVHVVEPGGSDRHASHFEYDLLGRQTYTYDVGPDKGKVYEKTSQYNAKGQLAVETTETRKKPSSDAAEGIFRSVTTNSFVDANGLYLLGAVSSSSSNNWYALTGKTLVDDHALARDTAVTNTYRWYDGASLAVSSYRADVTRTDRPNTSTYTHALRGTLQSVRIDDGRDRTVTLTNDVNGQAMRRDEADALTGGDPHEMWFRYGGREMGYAGNNGRTDVNYVASTQQRTAPSQGTGAFRGGSTTPTAEYDFDTSLNKLNSVHQGSQYGSYTVQGGESLQSIAANLWGDPALWYKLAEANGLTGASVLSEGSTLTIPAGVIKNTHNADTFKPYDASDAIGDTSPTAPKPGSKNKCGVFGAVLLTVVAVAVSLVVAPWATGIIAGAAPTALGAAAAGVAGLAIGGAAGSIVSQGVGLATGIQDKFSWKGVAMAGIAAGVGAVAGGGLLGGLAGNAVTQGIGLVTGLQKKFDWAGLAAAGVIGAVTGGLSEGLRLESLGANNTLSNHLAHAGVGMASAIAGGATRSLITGTSFGDNIMRVLPSVIGTTIGNAIGYGVSGGGRSAPGTSAAAAEQPTAGVDGGKVGGGASGINYITDPIVIDRINVFPELGAYVLSSGELDGAYISAGIDPFQRREQIRDEIARDRSWTGGGADMPVIGGQRQVRLVDTLHTPTLRAHLANYWDVIDRTGWMPGDTKRLQDFDVRLAQLTELDQLVEAQVRREIGGFLAAGVIGGATAAAGAIVLGGSLLAGAVTSGVSAGTSGVPLRWALGQENSLETFANDSAIGVGFYGATRVAGYAFGRVSSAATKTPPLTRADFPNIGTKISNRQLRHTAGTDKGGGFVNNRADAQAVLDAYHTGKATILDKTSQGFPVVRIGNITGTNVNIRYGIISQPTNVFIIKGTIKPSIVPTNPGYKSR